LGGRLQGKTCDAEMCDEHGAEIGPNAHYCPPHLAYKEKLETQKP
jgi:hypothetical protein